MSLFKTLPICVSGALMMLGAGFANAQTIFDHDANGNRRAQETAGAPTAPFISTMPADHVAMLGGTARFSVVAGGIGPFSYQWFKGAAPIDSANSDTLVISNLVAGDFTPSPAGTPKYSVQVTNAHSSVWSFAVGLYQDSIGAGLPNWWRQQYFGSLAAVNPNADADGDGVTNGQEYTDGTQPNNASSRQARVTLVGPPALMSKFPDRETYAAGSSVTASGGSVGELQFGGWTGSHRAQAGGLGFNVRGSGGTAGDVVLKGLFGSMPVETINTPPAFTNSNGTPAAVNGFATLPSGQWIAFGSFDRVNGQTRPYVARFTPDGTLDPAFAPAPNNPLEDAAFLPDGKFYLSGHFTQIGGQPASGVARFNADGTLDTSFTPPTVGAGFAQVMEIEPQRDGKLLLAGNVWNGSAYQNQLRLNADGSIDNTFAAVPNSPPVVFTQQPDGKILMAGNFTEVNGTPTPKLVRLNLDGTLDPSFSLLVAAGAVSSVPVTVLVQPDGKILVGGAVLVRLNGSDVSVPVARLNANGTLDSAFTQKVHTLAANKTFADLALQSDGRIVGVGTFTLANPDVVNAVRLNADGSADVNGFVISRPNAPVHAVAAQADGGVLIGGAFSSVAVGADAGNGHAYYFTAAKSGWRAAEAGAVRLGGHLVSISGPTENRFIVDTLLPLQGQTNYPAWTGFNDQGVEGIWQWASGEPAAFINWNPTEPSNFGGEDHGMINWNWARNGGNRYTWDDTLDGGTIGLGGNTDGPYYGIIEVDPAAAPATINHWVAGRDMLATENSGLPTPPTSLNQTVPEWSYGRRATVASTTLTLIDRRHTDGIITGWEATNYCGVLVSTSSVPGFYLGPRPLHPGEMYLHPGNNLECAVVRWTAPQAGTYAVSAFWQDFSWGGGDGGTAHIVVNGVEVFGYTFDNRNGASDTRVLTLNGDDTVDFVLGARGGFDYDGTRFNATVTKIQNASDLWVGGRDLALNEKPDGHANETTNPNPTVPQWSYGRRSTLVESGISLMSVHVNTVGGGDDAMEGWSGPEAAILSNTGTTPLSYSFTPSMPFNPGEMFITPGYPSGPFPVLRWTAPVAGRYELLAYWQDVDDGGGNGFSAHLLVNGGQVYAQDSDNGAGSSTVQSLDLKAGDQVDFIMGGRGELSYDTSKFNVAIVRPASSTVPSVPSGTLSQATTRAEIGVNAAVIDWANAGANNTDLPGNPFAVESSSGVAYLVRKSTTGAFNRRNQGAGWFGNFAPGDALLTHVNNDGPVIIEAASRGGVFSAIGMQIQPNQDGPFTATIRAYDSNGVLLGTFAAGSVSNGNADNSAVLIGVKSTVENIHSISVDTDTGSFGGDFAINRVSIQSSPAGSGNTLSNPRAAFARLVTTNHIAPLALSAAPPGPVYPTSAPATLLLPVNIYGQPVTFAVLESSTDGVNFQHFGYGVAAIGNDWSFPIAALPPGANYFRAVLTNAQHERARTHAVGPLLTPPVVTSALNAAGEVGEPFVYTATATGRLTAFTAGSLPAWATANYDANTGFLTISGTPTTGGVSSITLQPGNAAGSTPATLTLTVSNSFTTWRAANFTEAELTNPAISGPLGDATGAGIANLIKYALGIPPKRPGPGGLPTAALSESGGSDYLTLTYTRDPAATDVNFVVEVSGNLADWNSGAAHTTEVSRTTNPDGSQTVVVRDNIPSSSASRRFIQLKVSQ